MSSRARRVDGNHAEIRDALRKRGYRVADTSRLGDGFPDLVVGFCSYSDDIDSALLVEVKMPGKQLTPDEETFRAEWAGVYMIAHSADEVEAEIEKRSAR